ncbi:hypothetical protein [Microbulbifer sp. M83]|uniref:hypothetical protein n=1 Tax=Microbulbifer sp. M83 TaxID=3118246 RepID=UPI002FE3E629
MNIGLDKHRGKVYEGISNYGRELSPPPLISRCKLVTDKAQLAGGVDYENEFDGYIFREDYFDSKSRIRRGRFYMPSNYLTQQWKDERNPHADLGDHSTYTYHSGSLWSKFGRESLRDVYVLLGERQRYTVWKLVDMEVIFTGEELHTLKALTNFGVLPELLEGEIPSYALPLIKDTLDKVVDDMYMASAESIVDHCREAAAAIVSSFVEKPGKDLGKLVQPLRELPTPLNLAANAADTLAKLHSRRKSSEIQRHDFRRIQSEDAQHAVSSLGLILVELGWGRW